jgi:polar amino acid transport system permease protein
MKELEALVAWTPYLLGGFASNILIAALAMVLGTAIGGGLAWLRLSHHGAMRRTSSGVTEITRNTPTIVFQFYLALMLPGEWAVPGAGWIIVIPPWLKASIALAVAVVGFTSDNLLIALRDWRSGQRAAALLFVPSWGTYLLITIIASGNASIIGVSELVSRANSVIAATANPRLMIPVYLYAMLIFFLFCWPLIVMLNRFKARVAKSVALGRAPDPVLRTAVPAGATQSGR